MVAIYGRPASGSESLVFILKAVDTGQVKLNAIVGALEVDVDSTNNRSQVVLDIYPAATIRLSFCNDDGYCSCYPRGKAGYMSVVMILASIMFGLALLSRRLIYSELQC